MGSLQRFAKAVVDGDAAEIEIGRRDCDEIVLLCWQTEDRWAGSIGAWREALRSALHEGSTDEKTPEREGNES